AAGLARLARAGLPVPPGFAVPAACFVEALQAAGLWTRALALAERVDAAEASALRTAIARMELPPALQHGLALRAARLGPGVGVRSSAIAEDGVERSYAGQYATRLNVPVGDLADAIRHCWASLYSETALAYRKHGGPRPGSMGVVVQAMVEPHVAG